MSNNSIVENSQGLEWQQFRNCSEADPRTFYPDRSIDKRFSDIVRQAKEICNACVVKEDCLDYALSKPEDFGIWGGLTERERRHEVGRKQRLVGRVASLETGSHFSQ